MKMSEETAAETTQINTDVADGGGTTETPVGPFDGLADDLKGHESLKGIENLEQLVKAHVENTGKLAGLPVAPETPDAYDMGEFKVDSIGWDNDAETSFRAAAHEAGITQDQFSKVMAWAVDRSGELGKAFDAEKAKAAESLKEEWGNEYDVNMKRVGKTIDLAFGEEAAEVVNKLGIGNMPSVAKALLKFSAMLSEDAFVDGTTASGPKSAAEVLYGNQGK
jgi:hypothetical protein